MTKRIVGYKEDQNGHVLIVWQVVETIDGVITISYEMTEPTRKAA